MWLVQIYALSICVLSNTFVAADGDVSTTKREVNCTAFYIEKALKTEENPGLVSVYSIYCLEFIVFDD